MMGFEKDSLARRMIPADVALVVFGLDGDKKRHASRFGANVAPQAQKAAKAMGMRALHIVNDDQRKIALKLPRGRVLPKGRTVVSLVKPALYDKLLAVAGPGEPGKPSLPPTSPPPASPPGNPPPAASSDGKGAPPGDAKADPSTGWSKIVRGTVVLAKEKEEDGWYECVVQQIDGEVLTLRWQSWPDLPKFSRKLTQVALLHPKATKPC